MTLLLTTEISVEDDVVLARQRARQIAEALGFEPQDQTRVATALSEVARNAFQHAGRGSVQFHLEEQSDALALRMVVSDRGPGIGDVESLLNGQKQIGAGLIAARKLMDGFEIESRGVRHDGQQYLFVVDPDGNRIEFATLGGPPPANRVCDADGHTTAI